jgi:hypothetical protein
MPENAPTEPASATPAAPVPTPPAAAAPTTEPPAASWDDLFKGQDPAKVKEALEHSRKWETRAKENADKAREFDRLAEASKTELEKAQEAAAKADAKVQAANNRAVKAEVKALAAGEFADPDDAAAFLSSGDYLTADGEVDAARIRTDLADLLARKPHLAKPQGNRVPAPNPAQGSSANGPAAPGQLTKADLQRMHKEGRHEEIAAARAEGRFDQLLGVGH